MGLVEDPVILSTYVLMADVFRFSALARFIVEVVFFILGQYKYGTAEEPKIILGRLSNTLWTYSGQIVLNRAR